MVDQTLKGTEITIEIVIVSLLTLAALIIIIIIIIYYYYYYYLFNKINTMKMGQKSIAHGKRRIINV